MLESVLQYTRRHVPKELNLDQQSFENLKSREEMAVSIVKSTRCTIYQLYFTRVLEQHSTCFGRSLRPSSGV